MGRGFIQRVACHAAASSDSETYFNFRAAGRKNTKGLAEYFSEYGLIRYRVHVGS